MITIELYDMFDNDRSVKISSTITNKQGSTITINRTGNEFHKTYWNAVGQIAGLNFSVILNEALLTLKKRAYPHSVDKNILRRFKGIESLIRALCRVRYNSLLCAISEQILSAFKELGYDSEKLSKARVFLSDENIGRITEYDSENYKENAIFFNM